MASFRFSLLIFLALFISVRATTTDYSDTVSEPLLSVCRLTPEPETCLKYLSMFPQGFTRNIHNITALSVSASSFLAKEIHAFITLSKQESAFAVPAFEQCLTTSAIAIKDIVERLNDLANAVHTKSFADVAMWISDARTDASSAKKVCVGKHGQPTIPQLSSLISDLKKMLRVISALFKLQTN